MSDMPGAPVPQVWVQARWTTPYIKRSRLIFFLVRPSIPPAMAHDKLVLSRRPTPEELYSLFGSLSDSPTHSLMILPRHIFCQHLTKPRPPLPP